MASTPGQLDQSNSGFCGISELRSQSFRKILGIKDAIQSSITSCRRHVARLFRVFQADKSSKIQDLSQKDSPVHDDSNDSGYGKEFPTQLVQILPEEKIPNDGIKEDGNFVEANLEQLAGGEEEETGNQFTELAKEKAENSLNNLEDWKIASADIQYDDYRIGSGGFGTVHKGTWKNKVVAIKIMKNAEGNVPDNSLILSEAELWMKLHHPNILKFKGISDTDGVPFIVMSFIKQGNVRDFIKRNPDYSRLKIISETSQGIEYLHSNEVIHGDLKGANILIDDSNTAVLCDFGLSRMKLDANSKSTLASTRNYTINGSLHWMPPERLKGGSLHKPCDIYSFAMTMYEIYTNCEPMSGCTDMSHFLCIVVDRKGRPEKPNGEEAPQLEDEVWNLMVKCWDDSSSTRPNATAVRKRLQCLLDNPKPVGTSVPPATIPAKHDTAHSDLPDLHHLDQVHTSQSTLTGETHPLHSSNSRQRLQPEHTRQPPPHWLPFTGQTQTFDEPAEMRPSEHGHRPTPRRQPHSVIQSDSQTSNRGPQHGCQDGVYGGPESEELSEYANFPPPPDRQRQYYAYLPRPVSHYSSFQSLPPKFPEPQYYTPQC